MIQVRIVIDITKAVAEAYIMGGKAVIHIRENESIHVEKRVERQTDGKPFEAEVIVEVMR